jgi:hypothetical protein
MIGEKSLSDAEVEVLQFPLDLIIDSLDYNEPTGSAR